MVSKSNTSRRCRLGQLWREPTARSEQPTVLFSLADTSEKLNVSLQTVRRLVDDGKLDVARVRSRVLVTGESLHALMTGVR
jgi:excisionase family DNA binding protein